MRDKIGNVKKKMKTPKPEVGRGYPSLTEHDNALIYHTMMMNTTMIVFGSLFSVIFAILLF